MKCTLTFFFAAAIVACAQETDRIAVPLTDPSRAATVRVDLMHGDINVRTHTGKDVVVEMAGARSRRSSRKAPSEMEGLKRLDIANEGLDIEESENLVRINSGPRASGASVTVLVPQNASLKLKTMTGSVSAEGVRGEVEATSLNGQVRVINTEGAVVAHSLNGSVVVSLARVDPNKAMSFSTMNGDIDVTMPADTKAKVRLRNDHGEVWTDFDMKLESMPKVDAGRRPDGKYKVKFERTITGTINGGGPDLSFTTMNGQIRIRKQK